MSEEIKSTLFAIKNAEEQEWKNLYNYIKQLQQENKELKEKYNKALDILLDYRLPCEDDLLDDQWCEKNCDDNYSKCWNKFIEDKLKELKGSDE